MEQEDSKGTENPPEVLSSPQSLEEDDSKKDAIPPEGSSKPQPEGSSKLQPEGSSKPESEGFSNPELEGSIKLEESDKNSAQSLKAKSKILKKPRAGKVKINGSQQIRDKKRNMEQDSKGTENPLEVPSSPQCAEKDNSKKDAIPPEGSSKPEIEGSSKPEPEGSSKPEPEGSNKPEPEGSGKPEPEGSSKPEPEGSGKPEPEGSSKPEPEGSSKLEPADKNISQSLKAKSKMLKKSKAGKVNINGSRKIRGKQRSMEQEDKGTKNPPEVPSCPQSLEKDNSKKDAIPPEGSNKPQHEGSSKPQPEGSSKLEPSDKNTPQSLKVRSKILKNFKADKVMINGSQQIRGKRRNRRNKKVVGNTDEPHKEKSLEAEKGKEKEIQNKSTSDRSAFEKMLQAKKNVVELDKSEQKQKNKEKHRESEKGGRSRKNKAKQSGREHTESSERKREKLGGFIFMCSGKTKPDCFRYRVMGVTATKKDVVLGVRPGMKLFLYDFDLKLLYGVYKASSSGGMKLEPRAFGGNFPAQVRFNIARDCFPLPESIFKKAIKENYNEKHKFKTELTVRQVRKLTELFRPVEIRSALPPVSPPKAIIRDEEDHDGVRASWSHFHRERDAGTPYTNSNVSTYNVLSHQRDPRIERREEIPQNIFLTEKSYRAYGLPGDRRNVASASQVNPMLEPYTRNYEREHLHHLDPVHRESVPALAESLCANPHHLNEREHRTYFRGAISDYTEDPFHAYGYDASPRDPYFRPLSREYISSSLYAVGGRTLIGTDDLQRRETVHDRQYSTYSAADALSEYDWVQQYHQDKADAKAASVSSRYSFAGPSYSLR